MVNGNKIKLTRHGLVVTHLFFEDDLVLFLEASMDRILVVLDCLNLFYRCLGKKDSMQKPPQISLFFFFFSNVNQELVVAISDL